MHLVWQALCSVLLCIVLLNPAFAQLTGTIKGLVKDARTHEPLIGAEIEVPGKHLGTTTDSLGHFFLSGMEEGRYLLRVSYMGYQPQEKSILVHAGEIIQVEFNLEPQPIPLEQVLVEGERVYSAASSRSVRQFDIKVRPTRSAQDMLKMVPGLFIAQHAGGGKAEQIFLRGFDADHGTDVAIDVDGIPVNMVTHGHGQGYADLHFLIPEVVEGIEVFKGPYFVQFGNLATAGAVHFSTRDHLEKNLLRLELGQFRTTKATALLQLPIESYRQNAYFAAQYYQSDGPFESPQNFKRLNLFGKFHMHLSERSKLAFTVSTFGSAWNASGQIPERAVRRGLISRFGAIDDLEGGTTARQNVNLLYSLKGRHNNQFQIQAWASNYNFKLFSNFTFFLRDTTHGDMIEQVDRRRLLGVNSRYRMSGKLGNYFHISRFGGGFRQDNIAVGLWHSPGRVRQQVFGDVRVAEQNLYFWYQEEILFSTYFRMQLGLRGDYFTFNVDDRLDDPAQPDNGLPHASGFAQEAILSPKLNLVFSPTSAVDIFLNTGSGFHSNDARDVVMGQKMKDITHAMRAKGAGEADIAGALQARHFDPAQANIRTLPRAVGGELGLRARLGHRVNLGLAAWLLDMEEELVYVGDEGTTEISGPTRRWGVDLELRMKLLPYLWLDADVNQANARYKDLPEGKNYIPLAPRLTSTGGLTFIHPKGWEGALRYRWMTDRPANEDNTVVAYGYTVWDAIVGYRFGAYKISLMVENLLDTEWNEAQFDTESRLPGEAEPVSEIHFTPGNPRNVRVQLSYTF